MLRSALLLVAVLLAATPASAAALKAVPRAAAVERGKPTQLDGSGSKGDITAYRWSLAPGDGCPAGTPSGELEGRKVQVTMLCSM